MIFATAARAADRRREVAAKSAFLVINMWPFRHT
jgi:hypothetical protein